jgi:hypothetical protein
MVKERKLKKSYDRKKKVSCKRLRRVDLLIKSTEDASCQEEWAGLPFKTHGRIKNLQECGGSAVAKHGRIKSLQVAAGLYKSTEDREVTARNAADLPFTKARKKIRTVAGMRWINLCKILEILYAKLSK